MNATGWAVYDPGQDAQGTAWAGDREGRWQGAADRRAAWERDRRDARDELRARVWLSADVSWRLRALAARAGLSPNRVLAQLTDRVRIDDNGTLIEPFTPN